MPVNPTNAPTPAALCQLIAEIYRLPIAELTDNEPLFSSGRLDSFQLIELLSSLERTYAIKVAPGEVSLENLDTPRRMAEFLKRKKERITQ
ncbi:MAG: hypothetical protein JWM68_778 [Verrucomicrobiales bacterium]|nr:hypothetical protein [Verrucomicrobiales bacterium]